MPVWFLYTLTCAALFLCFSSAVFVESIYHDNTRYFRNSVGVEGGSDFGVDGQYGWLQVIGRPIAAEIENLIFKYTRDFSDLALFRCIVIGILAAGAATLAVLLSRFGLDWIASWMIATALFTLPGGQITVFMTNIPNALCVLLSLLACVVLRPVQLTKMSKEYWLRSLCAFLLLLSAFLTYQALTFCFLWGSLAYVLVNHNRRFLTYASVLFRDLILFTGAAITSLLIKDLFVHAAYLSLADNIPVHFTAGFSLTHILARVPHVFAFQIPVASMMWFISLEAGILVLLILVFSLLMYAFFPRERAGGFVSGLSGRISFLICVVFLLICIFGPSFFTTRLIYHRRVLFSGSAAILLVIFFFSTMALKRLAPSLSRSDRFSRRCAAVLILLIGLVSADYSMSQNVWNTNAEMMFVRTSIMERKTMPRRIHLVKPIRNFMGYNGRLTYSDEFNGKTVSFNNDVLDFVRLALGDRSHPLCFCDPSVVNCDQQCPDSGTIITISNYGERICRTSDMMVIDLNLLVRATKSGTPGLTGIEDIPPCDRYVFSTTSHSVHHNVFKAFDHSVLADDFWEAPITDIVDLNIEFGTPTQLNGYALFSGEAPERMPAHWRVYASDDSKNWILLDDVKNVSAWTANENRRFDVSSKRSYKYYRLTFIKAMASEILRIYEIELF